MIGAAILSFYRPHYSFKSFYTTLNDFENSIGWSHGNNEQTLTTQKSLSGKYSSKITEADRFSFLYRLKLNQLDAKYLRKAHISCNVFSEEKPQNLFLIFQISHGTESPFIWSSNKIELEKGKWTAAETELNLYLDVNPTDEIAAYIWNSKGNETIFMDDLQIKFY